MADLVERFPLNGDIMFDVLVSGSENYPVPDFDGVKCIVDPEKIGSRITSVIKYPPGKCRLSARSHPATLVYATIEEFKEDFHGHSTS